MQNLKLHWNMIIIKNLEKSILGDTLFENVNFKLTRGDKVGFIGKNGGGKTTLMKVILGLEEADSGTVDTEKERIAYVPQDIVFEENDTAEKFLQYSGNLDFKNTLKIVKKNINSKLFLLLSSSRISNYESFD